MPVRELAAILLALVLTQPAPKVHAQPESLGFTATPATCRHAAEQAESATGLPSGILLAIGRVESGRPDPLSAGIEPWPWTVNHDGDGRYFDTSQGAIAWTRAQLESGQHSIDVGCFQVNLLHHPHAFANLDAAFDPIANATYAAGFLRRLYLQSGSWASAIALYHSNDPAAGQRYSERVFAMWRGSIAHIPLAGAKTDDPIVIKLGLAASLVRVVVPSWAVRQIPTGQPPAQIGIPRVYGPGG